MASRADVDRKLLRAIDRLGRALRAARQQVATRHGLTPLQVQVLERLDDGGPVTVGGLAAELDVSQPTLSDAVATLDCKGFVIRSRAERDGRVTVIALTPAGTSLAGRIGADLAPVLEPGSPAGGEKRASALEVVLEEILRLQRAGIITVNRSCLSCDHYQPPATDGAGHCLFLDTPLRPEDLRVDCDEHAADAH
jgi:DNA-binding MarR family transcriptional regulator